MINNNNNNFLLYNKHFVLLLQNRHLLQSNKGFLALNVYRSIPNRFLTYYSNSNIKEVISNKCINNDLEFPIDSDDILFTLTFNPTISRENISNLISKIVVVKELSYININELSRTLAAMHIKELNIFSIDSQLEKMKLVKKDNGSNITYVEMRSEHFIKLLNDGKTNFSDYNRYSLYILRNGNFLGIKTLFAKINGCEVNVGRGGSQKAHALSPLDFRLSSYLIAMFNFNCGKIAYLNAFNDLDKEIYLSYMGKKISNARSMVFKLKEFRSIVLSN